MSNVLPLDQPRRDEPATKADISRMEIILRSLHGTIKPPRRRLTDETKAIHIRTIEAYYHEMCPCCGDRQVVDGGQRSQLGEFDHWTDNNSRSGPHETWLICAECHSSFTRHLSERHDCSIEWSAYQKRRRKTEARTRPLLL